MRKFPPRVAVRKTSTVVVLAGSIIFFAAGVAVRSQAQADWKQWTSKDVHELLTKSPWVARCCREWVIEAEGGTLGADPGYIATLVSSQAVREALVRHVQLDNRYERLDPARREEVDRRIAECLDEKFDNYIVLSFSFGFSDDHNVGLAKSDQIYLLTSDGRKVVGHLVLDCVETKCGTLANDRELFRGAPVHREIAFPRYADGMPTIGPADKSIRVELDFYRKSGSGHSVADSEIDFSIDKLIYQGKPDF